MKPDNTCPFLRDGMTRQRVKGEIIMKKKTSLVIMAAGIGSRFGGGIKQLTSFGPSGEIIMDYSIYDALRAGFDRIVFVIRRDLERDFREVIGDRIEKHVEVDYAFQELDDLPDGFARPAERTKPWGTGQAIVSCAGIVNEPFAVINADDYYGPDAFEKIHSFLIEEREASSGKMNAAMAGFILKNTLSEHGGVTRGICSLTQAGKLIGIAETKNIVKTADGAAVKNSDGPETVLDPEGLVSMNFWGFYPDFLDCLKEGFAGFLGQLSPEKLLTAEYLLPEIVDQLMRDKKMDVHVLPSKDRWFGVTYREDIPIVVRSLRDRINEGIYPERLWK